MARLLSLIAVHGLDAEALAARFPEIDPARFASATPWAWLRFDPAGADGPSPEVVPGRLGGLGPLAVEVREDPGGSWCCALYPKRGEPVAFGVHRGLGAPAAGVGLDRLIAGHERGRAGPFRTPAEELADVARKRPGTGLAALNKRNAKRVRGLLKGVADVARDEAMLRLVLTGGVAPVVGVEAEQGSLLDFLRALALEEAATGAVRPAFSDSAGDVRGLAPPAEPIAGGPVALDAGDAGRLWALAWFRDTDAEGAAWTPTGPRRRRPPTSWRRSMRRSARCTTGPWAT